MKFGKSLRNEIAETVPEWEGEYISYKDLKKQLKLIVNRSSNTTEDICFVQLLYSNLNKFQQFFMDKEEEYIIRLQELKHILANLDDGGDVTQVQRDLVDFHRELVLLFRYGVLNFQALLKIVKKHKKKTGTFIRLPGGRHPFVATDVLYKILRECEAMLNQLFPS
ncbi:hypothetical protein LguiA_028567 [Lonicera macranthoides]